MAKEKKKLPLAAYIFAGLVLGILVLTAVLRPLLGLFHAAETGDLPLTRIEQEWSDTYNGYREEG